MSARVAAVSRSADRGVRKTVVPEIVMMTGIGVEVDIHAGAHIRHLARMRKDPTKPNLRQVHLLHAEFHDYLERIGMPVQPGDMGENITTRGVALLDLPAGTRLHLGTSAVVEVTGLRNPCKALDDLHDGLMRATLERAPDGSLVRKSGIMSVVRVGGSVRAGDEIVVELPAQPHRALEPV